jgi:hypothetical protein
MRDIIKVIPCLNIFSKYPYTVADSELPQFCRALAKGLPIGYCLLPIDYSLFALLCLNSSFLSSCCSL